MVLDGQLLQIGKIDEINLNTWLSKREDILYRVKTIDNMITLTYYAKNIQLPLYTKEILGYILNNDKFTPSMLPNDIDDEGKLVLVKRLVREGFLTL